MSLKMKKSTKSRRGIFVFLTAGIIAVGSIAFTSSASATELPKDLRDILSRGHGAYEIEKTTYFVVDAGRGKDRTRDELLNVDDALSKLVLDYTTRITERERNRVQEYVHPDFFDDLLLAIKLDRRKIPMVDTRQVWLSEDNWTAVYTSRSADIEAMRDQFPQSNYDYAAQMLLRFYHASKAWRKLTNYYWRNGLYDDAFRAVSESSRGIWRSLQIVYPMFSDDPVANAKQVLRLGQEAFQRADLLEFSNINEMTPYQRAERALMILATFSSLDLSEIKRRLELLRRLDKAANWQEYLDSVAQSSERSYGVEWISIAEDFDSYIPLYSLRTAGTLRIKAMRQKADVDRLNKAGAVDSIKRLENAWVRAHNASENKTAWAELGDAMLGVKRRFEGLAIFRVALSIEPGDGNIREIVARLYGDLGYEMLAKAFRASAAHHTILGHSTVSLQ